jgi:ATP-dependent Clp protease ATP-binding subunit ClpC
MIRFDMSEYTDLEAADRLVAGTHGAEGLLTRRIREQPFGVLLLDEVEKAHPAVFDLLLQVLGEGRLTDGRGARRTSTTPSS